MATTRPALVRTCRPSTREPCTTLASDWTSMPCGGTEMPVSVLPSTGPLSVNRSTSASAGELSAFIRYRLSVARVCWPGETNQKSVAGAGQAACGSPVGPVCSAARPPDMPALARMATPPSELRFWARPRRSLSGRRLRLCRNQCSA